MKTMRNLFLMVTLLFSVIAISQTTTHRGRVKLKKAPAANDTDNIVSRNPSSGLITNTGITFLELQDALSGSTGGGTATSDFVPLEPGSTGGVTQGSNFVINQASSFSAGGSSNITFDQGTFTQGSGSTTFDSGAITLFSDSANTTFNQGSTTNFSGGSTTNFNLSANTTFTNGATTTFTNGAIFEVQGTNTYIGNGTNLNLSDGSSLVLDSNSSIDMQNVNIVSGIENGFTTGLQYSSLDNHQFVGNSLVTKDYVDNNQQTPSFQDIINEGGNSAIGGAPVIVETLFITANPGTRGVNITMGNDGGITDFPFVEFPKRGGTVAIIDETIETLNIPNMPVHNSELDALNAGLSSGDIYRTTTGELRVKL